MPRVWTAPPTWVDQTLVTANMLNTRIRDNTLWLKSPPFASVVIPSTNTTSTSFIEMTGSSVSLTSVGGNIFIFYCGVNSNNGFNISRYDLAIDGTRQDNTANGMTNVVTPVANQNDCVGLFWESSTPPSAGAHVYSVYWDVSGGTVTGAGYLFVMEER